MKNENEILALLKAGKKYREISAELGVDGNTIFKVAEAHRDEIPKRSQKVRWSFRPPNECTSMMLKDILEKGITPTALISGIMCDHYGVTCTTEGYTQTEDGFKPLTGTKEQDRIDKIKEYKRKKL